MAQDEREGIVQRVAGPATVTGTTGAAPAANPAPAPAAAPAPAPAAPTTGAQG